MPHYLWCLIKDNAEAIAAIAAAMAAIFTGLYFTYTIKIFRETKRAADAATTSRPVQQTRVFASCANSSWSRPKSAS
jgi:threonine/homoserine/homoserine lactone efflux protein